MLKYRIDVLQELKKKGYNTTIILRENIISQSSMQKIRTGEMISAQTLNKLCQILNLQPGQIIEYVEEN